MQVGDRVIYTEKFDADASENPNIGYGDVTKVNSNGTLCLVIYFPNGFFFKQDVPQGEPGQRGTWCPRPAQ